MLGSVADGTPIRFYYARRENMLTIPLFCHFENDNTSIGSRLHSVLIMATKTTSIREFKTVMQC
jgi:hypothetical protein